ncbi:MAG: hypothetical protein Kow0040_23470 [Thermogutta sp.]
MTTIEHPVLDDDLPAEDGPRLGNARGEESADPAVQIWTSAQGGNPWREMIRELLDFRELLWRMVWRDIRIRYKQAVMGLGWALLMPLMIVAAGYLVKLALAYAGGSSVDLPRVAGMSVKALGWAFFAGALGFAANSLTGNMQLVTKVYFPREVFPLSAVLTQAVDLLLGAAFLAVLLTAFAGLSWSWNMLWAPPLLLVLVLLTAAASMILSCGNVFFRDVKYIVQVILTFGIFFTPVFYEPEVFGPHGALIMMLNPLSPVLEGLRLAVIEGHNLLQPLNLTDRTGAVIAVWRPWYPAYSSLWAVLGFLGAWRLFHKLEFLFAEYI